MGDHNSLPIYIGLLERLLSDIAIAYPKSEHLLDWRKISSRVQSEGVSFLTKRLPALGKAFDKALQGDTPLLSPGFIKMPGTQLPKLFGWLFSRVLSDAGYVRSDADIGAIKHLRQLLYLLYKLELPYDEADTHRVLESFQTVNLQIKNLAIDGRDVVIRRARGIITHVLGDSDPRDIIPRHGPGAVATGERGGEKSHFTRIYDAIELEYPFSEYFTSLGAIADNRYLMHNLESSKAGTAKVVLVPKDSRGPRLISCEPLEYQWIQQGQQRKLYHLLESHPLTRGQVNFTSQRINRALALRSSKDCLRVTLDMKDASDRVGLNLVRELFSGSQWLSCLESTRSTHTKLPTGTVMELSSFAPMGSAVCFPVEALVFWALAVSILVVCKHYRRRVACSRVFVYGDDIICDREDYAVIMQHMERFGLLFNRDKCCVSGFFRESCGCDAYKGIDVTPIRLRKTWNQRSRWDATQLVSYVELSNSMHLAGYCSAAEYIKLVVEGLYGTLPFVEYTRSREEGFETFYHRPGRVIGFYRPDVNLITANRRNGIKQRFSSPERVKFNEPALYRHEVFGYSVSPVYQRYRENEAEAYFRTLVCGSTGLPRGMYALARRSQLLRKWGASGF